MTPEEPRQIRVPQIEDLFYLALEVLSSYDEPVPYRDMDDRAIQQLDLDGGPDVENRVRERLGFARSALKRIGAANNEQRGYWAITDYGCSLLAEGPEAGEKRISKEVNHSYQDRTADAGFLAEAQERAFAGNPMRLTVRELIEQWKVARRGSIINQQIHQDLATIGLRSEPDFATTWIDGDIVLVGDDGTSPGEPDSDIDHWRSVHPSSRPFEDAISLTVGSIGAANRGVQSIRLDDDLTKAQSVMIRFDYSQLAVISGERDLRGAISWESIGLELMRNPDETRVSRCLNDPVVVKPSDHLLAVVPHVVSEGFVLVQRPDKTLAGILTVSDLSELFASIANPFVLVGEVERWMRQAIDAEFTPAELTEAIDDKDPTREVDGAASLTLGEMVRVIENPDRWERLGWTANRQTFIDGLHQVRRIRNAIMHFSPDPLEEEELDRLASFLGWVRHLMGAR